MQLSVRRDALVDGVRGVARAVPARSIGPYGSVVLIEAETDRVTLAATDGDVVSVRYSIAAEVRSSGSIALPARLLNDLVPAMFGDLATIERQERSRQIRITSGRNASSIAGFPADEIHLFEFTPLSDGIAVDPDALLRAIRQTSVAVATDNGRAALTGVHFSVQSGRIRCAAADGFRLAVSALDTIDDDGSVGDIIVPAHALNILAHLVEGTEDPVRFTIDEQGEFLSMDIGHAEVIAKLINGSFPQFDDLIPSTYQTRIEVPVNDLRREVRSAAVVAREDTGVIRLYATPGEGDAPGLLRLTAGGDEHRAETSLSASITGPESRIAVNARYLQDALNVLDVDRVFFDITATTAPAAIRPVGIHEHDVHLIMPVSVAW